jgi:hypothetical protein
LHLFAFISIVVYITILSILSNVNTSGCIANKSQQQFLGVCIAAMWLYIIVFIVYAVSAAKESGMAHKIFWGVVGSILLASTTYSTVLLGKALQQQNGCLSATDIQAVNAAMMMNIALITLHVTVDHFAMLK